MTRPIFDINLIPDKNRDPEMKRLKAFIKKKLGGPCPYFHPACVVCRSWHAWLVLDKVFEKWDEPKKKK